MDKKTLGRKKHMSKLALNRSARGEVNEVDLVQFEASNEQELLSLLKSKFPVERTCAAMLLGKYLNPTVVDQLCFQLTIEKSLYTKIALTETLAKEPALSLEPLIGLLGKIGHNQETEIPEVGFYKVSYPLPRDISARTICRLGDVAIMPLENFMRTSQDMKAITQAIDAYGHIVYSRKIKCSSSVLQELYVKHPENNFLQYKIARCLSGIHDKWATVYLVDLLQTGSPGLRLEALRSLRLLKVEIPAKIRDSFTDEMRKLDAFLKM